MKNWVKMLVLSLFCILVGFLSAYYALNRHFKAHLESLIPQVEQVIIHDTLRLSMPLEIEKRVLVRDTIPIILRDTLFHRDTIWLPREQKVYADSTYRAVVSGIYPRLDSIEVYNRTIMQTTIVTKKEWRKFTYGVQGGVGLIMPFNSTPTFGGYIGLGIGYNF